MKRFIYGLLAALMLCLPAEPVRAQQAAQATAIATCGVPINSPVSGGVYNITTDLLGQLCISGALSISGSVTVTNAFNLEATQQSVLTKLTSIDAGLANPVPVVGTDGTNKTSSTNPLDVILRAGTAIAGKVGVDQTTPGTTNGVTPVAGTVGGATSYHVIAGASDNHAVIKNGAGTVYSITGTSIHTTYQYVRLYDAGTGFNGCNSATNLKAGWIIPGATTGAGGTFQIPVGIAFATGVSICITGAFSDTDTTNATASVLSVNVNYN